MKKSILTLIVVASVILLTFSQCKKDSCIEKHRKDCTCTEDYRPVCGCNGKTYDNACEAFCNEIDVVKNGPCD